jgi:hypothetical protein
MSLALLALTLGSCRGQPTQAPYEDAAAPATEQLLTQATPPLGAIQVPKAKIREGNGPAGTLMYAATGDPPRFSGSISAAGNELVSLAVNEREYGLRWLSKQGIAQGFYTGPPSGCAVQRLLGVALTRQELAQLLLGGAPIVAGAQVVDQRWQGKRLRKGARKRMQAKGRPVGHEVVRMDSKDRSQELRFAWFDGRWVFAGTSVYALSGEERRWLWSLDHEQLRDAGDLVFPDETVIRRPAANGDGEVALSITYLEQRPDPESLSGKVDEGGDDGWEDDGWEDDDGWDDDGESERSEPPSRQAPTEAADLGPPIPNVFVLDGSGLTPRGDLCRTK